MIRTTNYGHLKFTKALTDQIKTVHLITQNGELTEHGYAPKQVDPDLWDAGAYPKIVWEFQSGPIVDVIGYYVADDEVKMLFSEDFPEGPQSIQNTGDRIGVTIRLSLISGA